MTEWCKQPSVGSAAPPQPSAGARPRDGEANGSGLPAGRSLRRWVGSHLALVMFLAAYFVTIVLGNLLYPIPLGEWFAGKALEGFSLSQFPTATSWGYWLLLLAPLAIAPLVAIPCRLLLARLGRRTAAAWPEFRAADYLILLVFCYGYVIVAFWHANAFSLAFQGRELDQSGAARYELLFAIGYWPQMVLKSWLMFLSLYSIVQAFSRPTRFWVSAAIVNILMMSALLLMLNMKWPFLLFLVGALLCAYLFWSRFTLAFAAIAAAGLVIAYLVVGLLVQRWVVSEQAFPLSAASELLLVWAVNRMAIGYPYYYQTFTQEGQVCGTFADRIQRKRSPCQPSNLISRKISGNEDPLATQPAAVHISGYALGGWPGAMAALLVASILMGAFMALPVGPPHATVQTVIVMSGLLGYFFSQLSIEGAILYDHGMIWWMGLVLAYAGLRWATSR